MGCEDFKDWHIAIETYKQGESKMIEFEATNKYTKKAITKKLHEVD
jgi:hypothetical protein